LKDETRQNFDRDPEQIEFSKTKEDLVHEWNQEKQQKKGECFMIIPDQIAMQKPKLGTLKL
jgi:hypothetical protein